MITSARAILGPDPRAINGESKTSSEPALALATKHRRRALALTMTTPSGRLAANQP